MKTILSLFAILTSLSAQAGSHQSTLISKFVEVSVFEISTDNFQKGFDKDEPRLKAQSERFTRDQLVKICAGQQILKMDCNTSEFDYERDEFSDGVPEHMAHLIPARNMTSRTICKAICKKY